MTTVLFFDKINLLAPRRGSVGGGGGVMERVVVTILVEVNASGEEGDGDGEFVGCVVVVGPTNRPDLLDPFLL